jgi:hypothetical protein
MSACVAACMCMCERTRMHVLQPFVVIFVLCGDHTWLDNRATLSQIAGVWFSLSVAARSASMVWGSPGSQVCGAGKGCLTDSPCCLQIRRNVIFTHRPWLGKGRVRGGSLAKGCTVLAVLHVNNGKEKDALGNAGGRWDEAFPRDLLHIARWNLRSTLGFVFLCVHDSPASCCPAGLSYCPKMGKELHY